MTTDDDRRHRESGRHLRGLLERKRRLRRILPAVESRLRYLDHLTERGSDSEACSYYSWSASGTVSC